MAVSATKWGTEKKKKNNRFEEITQHLDVSIMIVIKLHS